MSAVVSDSSPLNILVRIAHTPVLPELFESVVIPPVVVDELVHPSTPAVVRSFMMRRPEWLQVRKPAHLLELPTAGPGERAAISLAAEEHAVLIVDDRPARKIAQRAGVSVIGTLGVLELGASRGLIDLSRAISALRETDFRIDESMLEDALERWRRRSP